MGLELTTLRPRVTSSTDGASQMPLISYLKEHLLIVKSGEITGRYKEEENRYNPSSSVSHCEHWGVFPFNFLLQFTFYFCSSVFNVSTYVYMHTCTPFNILTYLMTLNLAHHHNCKWSYNMPGHECSISELTSSSVSSSVKWR